MHGVWHELLRNGATLLVVLLLYARFAHRMRKGWEHQEHLGRLVERLAERFPAAVSPPTPVMQAPPQDVPEKPRGLRGVWARWRSRRDFARARVVSIPPPRNDTLGEFLTQYDEYLDGKRSYSDLPSFPSAKKSGA